MHKLCIPVLLGTTRPGRKSALVAQLIHSVVLEKTDIESILVDPLNLNFSLDGNAASEENPHYHDITARADGFIIVTPEYNHSFPGSLKRMLDSEYDNYAKKPALLAGVSSEMFGGARAVEALIPVLRKLGLVTLPSDLLFPNVSALFDENGSLIDDAYLARIHTAISTLTWMAQTLKWGREHIHLH